MSLSLLSSTAVADTELEASIAHEQGIIAQAHVIELQKVAFDAMQKRAKELGYSDKSIEASPALMGLFSGSLESMANQASKLSELAYKE